MPTLITCRQPLCNKTYDFDKNSSWCPHDGFPRAAFCKKHNRNNCGHPECQSKLIEMPPRKEVRK